MKTAERPIKEVKHQRGLVIGLGGTGADVLAGNRQRIIETYGSMDNVPMLRYLYVDTNPQWWQSYRSKVEESVALSEQEHIDIQFPDTTELYQGIRQNNYPNYGWFDLPKLESIRGVIEGAGTVRQMARLAFWHSYSKIRDAIKAQLNALRDESVATYMRTHHGIELDPGVNVYIVAGLAGGTGSGLWLDMAYLVRKILKDMGITGANQVIGYGVLPQAYTEVAGNTGLANGYAVLKELNYFSYLYAPERPLASVYGEPLWDADYQRNSTDRATFKQEAPFDFCYLMDARNAEVDLRRKDIYRMIDSAIFQEFAGGFGPFKRALRANIKGKMVANDLADCPIRFMGFGQASAQVPMPEIKQVLAHQLALLAVQQWVDKKAKPIKALITGADLNEEEMTKSVVGSIRDKAQDPALLPAVRGWVVGDFTKRHSLDQAGVLAAIVQDHNVRLTDVPYRLAEAVRQEWVGEKWPINKFMSKLSDVWDQWKTDFNDENADPMRWGERIRTLEANKKVAFELYERIIQDELFRLFEDSERFGPAWAVCAIQQLSSALDQLKRLFVKQANDANVIANALGDLTLTDAVTGSGGASLSTLIDAEVSKRWVHLDRVIRSVSIFGKRKAVDEAAYQYLRYCAHWCRAKVEQRARREAGDLLEQCIQFLGKLEERMIELATVLASLEGKLAGQTRAWHEKAALTEHVGTLLYDTDLLERLESKLRERRGDQFSASAVAQKALKSVGGTLRNLKHDDVPALLNSLVEAGLQAVGDVAGSGLEAAEFAAHELLSAAFKTNDTLDSVVKGLARMSGPYVRFATAVADGGWSQDDLIEFDAAGLRGGGWQENDPDKDHARVIASLNRAGWNVVDGVKAVDDLRQITLAQEFGGFPLRALQGILELKKAYDQHRQSNSTPLHIVKDELAECYPDLFPPRPELLARARIVQTVAIPLGFVSLRDFPSLNGNGKPNRQFAFLRRIAELGEVQPIPVGRTIETVGLRLAGNLDLLTEIERAIGTAMDNASSTDRAEYTGQLLQHLTQKKAAIKADARGVDGENTPAYQAERDRIVAFMRQHGLVNGGAECERDTSLPIRGGTAPLVN